jgi:hypothetical protein
MSWLARFLAWTTVLAVPFWLLGDVYHRGLAAAALAILGIPSAAVSLAPPEIPASHALGVFAALCLASTRAPLGRRLLALSVGLIGLAALELATGVLAIGAQMASGPSGAAPDAARRLQDHLTALPAWIGAPVAWLVLLGRWELPPAVGRGSGSRAR